MQYFELFLIAIALSLDAFAVSVCKGLQIPHDRNRIFYACRAGLYFGFFQALMPLIGYFFGDNAPEILTKYSHYFSFLILLALGANMMSKSFKYDEFKEEKDPLAFIPMLAVSIATSIDALTVGFVFRFNYTIAITTAISVIGVVTFIICVFGVQLGYLINLSNRKMAERAGAIVLMGLGFKFLFV